jgi:hypothetical protein
MQSMNDKPYHLKHRDELLDQIATGVAHLGDLKVHHVIVTFRVDGADGEVYQYDFDLAHALKAIANDLYWDERGDWSEATTALVESL